MVGGSGIEPLTFAMSTRRSPAELTARQGATALTGRSHVESATPYLGRKGDCALRITPVPPVATNSLHRPTNERRQGHDGALG
jgi:hypothetical protein